MIFHESNTFLLLHVLVYFNRILSPHNWVLLLLIKGGRTMVHNLHYLVTTKGYVNTNTYILFVMQAHLHGHNNASGVC
ncbi:hypothetical protein WN48_10808 [Eufriesea mexicana]|uniref:Uncharacterized protein n=1 Tax=Eufriesea mexicana TaxID=516756 RepID=A0A310SBH7_9HYME|nr:hypothetical protein WN48_10808 [Eufriesea mexicana]